MGKGWRITLQALLLLAALEGFRSMPYQDIAGVWTDGYGNTEQVVPGKSVTEVQSKAKLQRHVDKFTDTVVASLTIEPTQGQLDGYVLLTYNIGGQAFRTSTTVKDHNAGRFMDACLRMLRFDKARVNGTLRSVKGLANRRYEEYNLCIAGVPKESLRYGR